MASHSDSRRSSRRRRLAPPAPAAVRRTGRHGNDSTSTSGVIPCGVTPSASSTTRNVHRRTTRSSSGAPNGLVTPASLRSIRQTAWDPARGTGQRDALRFTNDYSYQRIVASQEGAPAASPLRASTNAADVLVPTTAADVPTPAPAGGPGDTPPPLQFCYCDSEIPACPACDSGAICPQHVGLYCSGTCGRWFHAACTGWHSVAGAGCWEKCIQWVVFVNVPRTDVQNLSPVEGSNTCDPSQLWSVLWSQ
jgi:hypothetical protein